jgi:maltose O-acetyltransferase
MPDNILFIRLRGFLASFFFAECGSNFRLGRNVTFYNPSQIYIGKNTYIAYGNWFCADDKIIIDDEVMFGPYSIIVSSNHSRKNKSFRYGPITKQKIIIESGAWIGGHCNILSGSHIGSGSVISAGSSTFKKIPKDSKVINGKILPIENLD